MSKRRQENTVGAYIRFLQSKNIDASAIEFRVKFVNKLVGLLQRKYSRAGYGRALQAMLKSEYNIEPQQQLNIAREFYPFWVGDVKSIVRASETYGFDLSSVKLKTLPTTLDWSMPSVLEDVTLNDQETKLLKDYSIDLEKQCLVVDAIQARQNLVKVILLLLRDIPMENSTAYRMAVDVALTLFELDDLKKQFLASAREFFYVWIETIDPEYLAELKLIKTD